MADQTIYLKVKNWERFQQYKDGRPLRWIKLYVKILGDYEFEQLPEPTQLHLMKVWLLAAESDNRIPCNPEWIARRIGAKSPVDVKTMVEDGWLGVHGPHNVENALKSLPSRDVQSRTGQRTQHALARGEKRREEESTEVSLPTVEKTSEGEPRVEMPEVEETEPWNDRLAPVIREAAYHGEGPPEGHKLSRCLSKAKQLMGSGYTVDDLEDAIRGLRRMAETKHEDVRDWLEPGDRFTVLAFGRAEENGQKLVQVAAHEWRKRGPPSPEKRRRSGPVRVSEVAGGV